MDTLTMKDMWSGRKGMHAHLFGIESGGAAGNLCLRIVKQPLQAFRSHCGC